MVNKTEKRYKDYAHKCSGIPCYPAEHSLYDEWLIDVPENRINDREKRVEKFLKKFINDHPVDDM